MANRYVRSTGGNWNSATTWESASGLKDTVAIPTAADDVYLDAQSGQLTINADGACRSFDCTGYTNTITHNAFTITIGTTTARNDNVACVLSGTYNLIGPTAILTFSSTSTNVQTIDFANKIVGKINFNSNAGKWKMISDWSMYNSSTTLNVNAGTLDTNSKTMTNGGLNSDNSGSTRNIIIGSSVFNLNYTQTMELGRLTFEPNSATFNLLGAGTITNGNFNGANLVIKSNFTFFITSSIIVNNFIIDCSTFKTIEFGGGAGTHGLICNNFYQIGNGGLVLQDTFGAINQTYISKSSGVVDIYQASISKILFTGGATWNARNNVTLINGAAGLNQLGGAFYMDYLLGNNATTNTPYGWWSVAYTGATGTAPVEGETVIGTTSLSTAKITGFVNPYEWSIGSGTLYFYGKSAPFQAEIVTCANGGTFTISSDFTYCAWKDITNGATAARIAPGDEIRIAKSPDPTSLGQTATWTSTTVVGGGMEATKAISAMEDNGSGLIRLTTASQTWVTGDVVQVLGLVTTGGTYEANGNWIVTVINSTTIDLQGSTYVNTRSSDGTARKITSKCVILTNPVTQTIENCENNWTPGAQTTSSNADTSIWKEGRASVKVITAATCNANQILAKFGLPVALDLNAGNYQQLSFWIRNETSALTSGDLEIRLYGEQSCTTLRDKFIIPAIPSTARFLPITIDLSANIGSGSGIGGGAAGTIQGIALYNTVQFNNKTVYLDNIIACKGTSQNDSLTLQSLISKNTLKKSILSYDNYGNEGWYAIQSINDKIIILDNETNTYGNAGRGYYSSYSDQESCVLYKRETIKTTLASSSSTTVQSVKDSGTSDNKIKYYGGFDKLTNTQIGETIFDGLNGNGYGINIDNISNILLNNISILRYFNGYFTNYTGNCIIEECSMNNNNYPVTFSSTYSTGITVQNIYNINNNGLYFYFTYTHYAPNNLILQNVVNINNNSIGVWIRSEYVTITNITNICNNITGIYLTNDNGGSNTNKISNISNLSKCSTGISINTSVNNIFKNLNLSKNSTSIYLNVSSNNSFYNTVAIDNSNYGINSVTSTNNIFYNFTTSGNTTSCINIDSGIYTFVNSILDGTFVSGVVQQPNLAIYCQNFNNTPNNHMIVCDGGRIYSDITNRHTDNGICWKMSITYNTRILFYPLVLSIAKVAVKANTTTTVKVWVKKTSATDIGAQLVVKGGQLNGMSLSDYTSTATDITDYQQLSVSFPSTETGVVDVQVWAYYISSVSDSVYVDDFSIEST